jgi:hypothetical protein
MDHDVFLACVEAVSHGTTVCFWPEGKQDVIAAAAKQYVVPIAI